MRNRARYRRVRSSSRPAEAAYASFRSLQDSFIREPLLTQVNTRIRDVRQGPDGLIYIATEMRIGRTASDGTVLRIEPAN